MSASGLFGSLSLAMVLCAAAGAVRADETAPKTEPPAEAKATVTTDAAPVVSPFGTQKPVSEDTLRESSGREDVSQTVVAENTANVSNNSVNGTSVTGTITLDGTAFQNMNGLSVLSANTGNNVAINASMNVNVAIRQ